MQIAGGILDYDFLFKVLQIIVIPGVAWIFHNQREHNKEMQEMKKEISLKVPFRRFDEEIELRDKTFVRVDNYNTANFYKEKADDEKFKNVIKFMETNFNNIEEKIDELKKDYDEERKRNDHR